MENNKILNTDAEKDNEATISLVTKSQTNATLNAKCDPSTCVPDEECGPAYSGGDCNPDA